jgi:hypothetical protein
MQGHMQEPTTIAFLVGECGLLIMLPEEWTGKTICGNERGFNEKTTDIRIGVLLESLGLKKPKAESNGRSRGWNWKPGHSREGGFPHDHCRN